MHWDQEPIRLGPRAVPARSGRAKTRAWVIFQGCWRGPHAATGDRSRSALRTGNSRATAGSWREPSFIFSAWIGTMNLTTRWERGSVSRSTLLQPQVLRSQTRAPGRQVHGEPSFASRMHWDQEPIRFGPRAVPARSGRAKTRAWVIFQGCWRGPHAATGDRSRSALRTGNSRATAGSWREPSFVFSAWIGTMNLTTRWERGSASRSASLQPPVLRVTDPRSGMAGSWRALFRCAYALGP